MVWTGHKPDAYPLLANNTLVPTHKLLRRLFAAQRGR